MNIEVQWMYGLIDEFDEYRICMDVWMDDGWMPNMDCSWLNEWINEWAQYGWRKW